VNIQKTVLVLALSWNGIVSPAQVQTNDAQQKALEVLRKAIESMEAKPLTPGKAIPRPSPERSFADTEQLFLQDKITGREFKKYLDGHKLDPAKILSEEAQAKTSKTINQASGKSEASQTGLASAGSPKTDPPPARAKETFSSKPTEASSDQGNLTELEKKMDELLRLKAAREKQAGTNVLANTASNSPARIAPKTKRERLNELLLLVVQGKITDAEYKEKRAKLINEPD